MKLDVCPVCKSKKVRELYPANIDLRKLAFTYAKTQDTNKTFRVVRCLNCSHVFCAPIPKDIYKNYEDVVDKEYLEYVEPLKISARLVLPAIKKYAPKGKLLDVGCATGEFLEVAREAGYLVEGLELSKWSAELAGKKGIKIYRQSIKSLSDKFPKMYDVITLFGVIEHFEKPLEEMTYLNKLLKPGGVIAIWTGDVDSISSKLTGRKWWYWQGQHIQYFTHKSLSSLMSGCGFIHLTTKLYPFIATSRLMYNYLGRYPFRALLTKLLKPVFLVKPVWAIRLPGEMLWIGKKAKA